MTLEEFFKNSNKIAICFSGGTDSAYLLYAAAKYNADARAYFVKTAFQPMFEATDAKKIAELTGIPLTVIEYDIVKHREICENSPQRCYYCKTKIMSIIKKQAKADGYEVIADGTNASDRAEDRPGMRALKELNIKSPLKECGISKSMVRELSKKAGLFTWNKAAYACLATRIRTGEAITEGKLKIIERAETVLFEMGYNNFRVRLEGDNGRIELLEEEMEQAFKNRGEITKAIGSYFNTISIDLKGRRNYEQS